MHNQLVARHRALGQLGATLDALSPLRVLDRGFGLVRDGAGAVVTDPARLGPGERIAVRFARGTVDATVDAVRLDPPPDDEGA